MPSSEKEITIWLEIYLLMLSKACLPTMKDFQVNSRSYDSDFLCLMAVAFKMLVSLSLGCTGWGRGLFYATVDENVVLSFKSIDGNYRRSYHRWPKVQTLSVQFYCFCEFLLAIVSMIFQRSTNLHMTIFQIFNIK